MAFFCWSSAFGFLCNALNGAYCQGMDELRDAVPGTNQRYNLVVTCVLLPLPILLALDVAATSSRCDLLTDALNQVAISYGESCHLRVDYLLGTLHRINRGQGLGFRVFGAVIDRRRLMHAAAALAGGATTLITTLIALHEEAGTSTLLFEQCQLTPQQTAIIRNLLEFDEDSCAGLYNISLDRILERA